MWFLKFNTYSYFFAFLLFYVTALLLFCVKIYLTIMLIVIYSVAVYTIDNFYQKYFNIDYFPLAHAIRSSTFLINRCITGLKPIFGQNVDDCKFNMCQSVKQ